MSQTIYPDNDPYFVDQTVRFRTYDAQNDIGFTKDGSVWDTLTNVYLFLKDPLGAVYGPFDATAENANSGLWYCDSVETGSIVSVPRLYMAGKWRRWWRGTDGTVTMEWGPREFMVKAKQ